jgi:hypothetical protein
MGRLSRGWGYANTSLSVVRRDPALTVLAVLGIVVAVLLAAVPFAAGLWALDGGRDVLGYVLLAVAFFLAYFATVFSGVAIALAAARVLDGQDATVGASINGAMARLPQIVSWAVVGAAVNLAFALLRDRAGAAGSILAAVGGAAWSLVTFLAVPVVAFEGLGPVATLKRSAGLFRERWGEQLTGNVSINLVFFLLSLPAVALAVLGLLVASGGSEVFGIALTALGIVVIAVVGVIGRAASATFGAVLYRYAATGEASGPFAAADLQGVARAATGA